MSRDARSHTNFTSDCINEGDIVIWHIVINWLQIPQSFSIDRWPSLAALSISHPNSKKMETFAKSNRCLVYRAAALQCSRREYHLNVYYSTAFRELWIINSTVQLLDRTGATLKLLYLFCTFRSRNKFNNTQQKRSRTFKLCNQIR